jgi:hypothetical protein
MRICSRRISALDKVRRQNPMRTEVQQLAAELPGTGIARAGRLGLALEPQLDLEAWRCLVAHLARLTRTTTGARQTLTAWLGDALAYGDIRYRGRIKTCAGEAGLEPGTLRNAKMVCSRIPVSCRHDALSWSHHCEVGLAFADPAEIEQWLALAEREKLSTAGLRKRIRAHIVRKQLAHVGYALVALRLNKLRPDQSSRHMQSKRLPPKPAIDAEILGVRRHNHMLAMQFREADQAGVGIVHPPAIAGQQRAHRRRFVGQDRNHAQNAAFNQGKNLLSRFGRAAQQKARFRNHRVAGERRLADRREFLRRPFMPLIVAVERADEWAGVENGVNHGRTRRATFYAGRFGWSQASHPSHPPGSRACWQWRGKQSHCPPGRARGLPCPPARLGGIGGTCE